MARRSTISDGAKSASAKLRVSAGGGAGGGDRARGGGGGGSGGGVQREREPTLAEVDALHVAVDPAAELRRRRAARKLADVDQPVAFGAARDEDAKLLDADDARQRCARRQRGERRSRRAAAAGRAPLRSLEDDADGDG